jgi:hypothetical protein
MKNSFKNLFKKWRKCSHKIFNKKNETLWNISTKKKIIHKHNQFSDIWALHIKPAFPRLSIKRNIFKEWRNWWDVEFWASPKKNFLHPLKYFSLYLKSISLSSLNIALKKMKKIPHLKTIINKHRRSTIQKNASKQTKNILHISNSFSRSHWRWKYQKRKTFPYQKKKVICKKTTSVQPLIRLFMCKNY